MEHLSGYDDGLLGSHTLADYAALYAWNTLNGHFYAEVASGNHYAIGGFDDLVDVVNSLLVLYL